MKFVLKENSDIWVALQDHLDKDDFKKQVLEADVCISDLDDTDAKSPAKRVVIYDNLLNTRIFDPKFIGWAFRSLKKFVKERKKAESECWKEYADLYLRNPDEVQKIVESFDNRKIESLTYKGVKDFYELLPDVHKVYFSRNIREIVEIFSKYFGFDESFFEIIDKEKKTKEFVERDLISKDKKPFRRYIVRGDSVEDEATLEVLNNYKKKGKIDYVVSCFRSHNGTLNENVNANVGKSDFGLVKILS